MKKRLLAILLALGLTLALLPTAAFAADAAGTCTITLHYDENLCTVTANSLVKGDNGLSNPSETTVIVTGNDQSVQTPAGTWLQFQIDNIASGYRIKSVTLNGTDHTEGFINGAYGGLAISDISTDYTLLATMEPVPQTLPSVSSVALYTDSAGAEPVEEYITYTSESTDARLYGKAAFSDGQEYPIYYAMGQWQYSTDGITWHDAATWGGNRFDFWPGWEYHTELNFLTASYDIRLKVEPQNLYTTGEAVYSNVIHINSTIPQQPTTPDKPDSSTAYASTQNVLVDGKPVEFQAYALKDASGNDTNYIKLRDVAYALNGTAAQFDLGWDQDAKSISVTSGAAYKANGSEMKTPYSGNRAYTVSSSPLYINGKAADLEAILLTDDAGNGYTYFKLRDLGEALGFAVDWSAEKGIYIETE